MRVLPLQPFRLRRVLRLTQSRNTHCSIGDVHGQFYDFMHLLSLTGKPSPTHTLVFDGDLVDRGSWSVEILLTVFCYKCAPRIRSLDQRPCDETDASTWNRAGLYPRSVFINRGNHETSDMNRVYGYEGESTKSALILSLVPSKWAA